MKNTVKQWTLIMITVVTMASSAWAGCNPCICGGGGGLPPPPDCGRTHFTNQLSVILSQPAVQDELASHGGLANIETVESENSVVYQFTTEKGDVLTTPTLQKEIQ